MLFLLSSPFVEEADDYSDVYQVYRVPEAALGDTGDAGLLDVAEQLQVRIPVSEVVLDSTRLGRHLKTGH
jgi:hypothetical protein